MANFIDDQTLTTLIAAALKKTPAQLASGSPYWSTIISAANAKAAGEITTRLATRGFSAVQIAGWDRGIEFQKDLGRFWALSDGAGLHDYSDKFIRLFDRREELDLVQVTVAGVWQAAATALQITTGPIDTSSDLFSLNPDDPRRGGDGTGAKF